MRAPAIVVWTVAAVAIASCSDEDRTEERVNVARHAARFECPTPRFGMACDPDSSGDVYGECDGLCTFDTGSPSGRTVCVRIAELGMPHLENYLCGEGAACTQTCNQSGACVTAPALNGTACSEPGNGNKCARQCTAGTCEPIEGTACAQGRDPGGCGFRTCAPFAATQCVTIPYPTTTACSGGTCDGCGVCSSSGPGVCLDGGQSADAGPLCGNGALDALELCDLTNLGGETCESVTLGALPHGTLRCSSSCIFDLRDCSVDGGAGAGGAAGDGSAGAAGTGTSGAGGIAAGGSAGGGAAGTGAIDAGAGTGGTVAIDASAGAGGIDASAGAGGTVASDASAGSGGTVASDASAGSGGSAGREGGVAGAGGLAAGGAGGLAAGGSAGFGTGGADAGGGAGGVDAGGNDGSGGFGGVEGGAGSGGADGAAGSGGVDGGAGSGGADGAAGSGGASGASGSGGLGGGTAGGTGGTPTAGTSGAAGAAGAAGSAGSRARADGYVEGGGCDCRVGRSRAPSEATLGALCGLALAVSYWRRRRRQ